MASFTGSGMPGEISDQAGYAEAIPHKPEGHRGGGLGFKPFRTNTSGYPNPMVGGSARIGGMPDIGRARPTGKPSVI